MISIWIGRIVLDKISFLLLQPRPSTFPTPLLSATTCTIARFANNKLKRPPQPQRHHPTLCKVFIDMSDIRPQKIVRSRMIMFHRLRNINNPQMPS